MQEICLARMLKVFSVVMPAAPYVRVILAASVALAPNSVYTIQYMLFSIQTVWKV